MGISQSHTMFRGVWKQVGNNLMSRDGFCVGKKLSRYSWWLAMVCGRMKFLAISINT